MSDKYLVVSNSMCETYTPLKVAAYFLVIRQAPNIFKIVIQKVQSQNILFEYKKYYQESSLSL